MLQVLVLHPLSLLNEHQFKAKLKGLQRGFFAEATIIARARYQSYQEVLEKAGADIVINEEASVGKDLGEIALKSLEFEEN